MLSWLNKLEQKSLEVLSKPSYFPLIAVIMPRVSVLWLVLLKIVKRLIGEKTNEKENV